jgi:hypothetical protein
MLRAAFLDAAIVLFRTNRSSNFAAKGVAI